MKTAMRKEEGEHSKGKEIHFFDDTPAFTILTFLSNSLFYLQPVNNRPSHGRPCGAILSASTAESSLPIGFLR